MRLTDSALKNSQDIKMIYQVKTNKLLKNFTSAFILTEAFNLKTKTKLEKLWWICVMIRYLPSSLQCTEKKLKCSVPKVRVGKWCSYRLPILVVIREGRWDSCMTVSQFVQFHLAPRVTNTTWKHEYITIDNKSS